MTIDPSSSAWSTLPLDAMRKILGHLDPRSLVRASAVTKAWRAEIDDDRLWQARHRTVPVDILRKVLATRIRGTTPVNHRR